MTYRRVKRTRWDVVALIAVWVVAGFVTGLTAARVWWVASVRCMHGPARLSRHFADNPSRAPGGW